MLDSHRKSFIPFSITMAVETVTLMQIHEAGARKSISLNVNHNSKNDQWGSLFVIKPESQFSVRIGM